jgi:hypothetical protein
MAQQTSITFVDDVDGKEIKDNDQPTVHFSLDGVTYEIDLHDRNQSKLREALAPFIDKAKRVGAKTGKAGKKTQSGPSAKEVRDWARSNGFDVPDRGAIPKNVREAFDAK